jgi:hypothetical protein
MRVKRIKEEGNSTIPNVAKEEKCRKGVGREAWLLENLDIVVKQWIIIRC